MIEVAAAIIENGNGEILIARRRKGKAQEGLWEFPGGKIERGESPEACLKRELLEEMNIEIEPRVFFGTNEHDYGSGRIRLIAYKSVFMDGEIALVDHDEFRWAKRGELKEFRFAPADVRFVEMLEREQAVDRDA